MVSEVEAQTRASSSVTMAWVTMSAPAPPYASGMPNDGNSSSRQAAKDSHGNSAVRSTSAAWGAIRSSAKWRRVSRNWRCSSVRAKVESVMLTFSQRSSPGLVRRSREVLLGNGVDQRALRHIVVGDRGEGLPAGRDQCRRGVDQEPPQPQRQLHVVDAGTTAEAGGPTGRDEGAAQEDIVLGLALRELQVVRETTGQAQGEPGVGPRGAHAAPAERGGRLELGGAGRSSRPRARGDGGPAEPGPPR